MTFKLETIYNDRVVASSTEEIRGKFKDRTAPTSVDGSYLQQAWVNDIHSFGSALLYHAQIEPNGNVDTMKENQQYDALVKIIDSRIAGSTGDLYGLAGGSANALTVTFQRPITSLYDGLFCYVRASYANTSTAPTLKVGNLAQKAIVKGNNIPLLIGDIAGAGYTMHLKYDSRYDRWILLNPAFGVMQPETIPVGTIAYFARTGDIDGWLYCDDRVHQRSQYPRLVSQCPQFIQSTGNPDTFKLIDLRGYFLRALDGGRGVDVGRAFGSIQSDMIKSHNHQIYASNWQTGGGSGGMGYQADQRYWGDTENTGGSETRPKNIALPLYIKY